MGNVLHYWLTGVRLCLLCWPVVDACAGQTNWALRTSTTNQVVEVPHSPALEFGTNFTVEAWVKISREASNRAWEQPRMAVGRPNADGSNGIGLGIATPFYVFYVNRSDGIELMAVSSVIHGFEHWVHIAGTFDGHGTRLYRNGTQFGASTPPTSGSIADTDQSFFLGGEGLEASTGQWLGEIDEVRIWRRVLTEEEIRSRMWTKLAGNEPQLAGYWNFDGGDATDLSPFGSHGVLRGDVQFAESTLFLASRPRLRPVGFAVGQGFQIFLPTERGVDYMIQASEDSFQWESLGTVQGDDSVIRFSDPMAASLPRRFYRAEVLFIGPR